MRITTDHWPHPLTAEGRATRTVALAPGTTLAALVAGVHRAGDVAAAVNGAIVPREAWEATVLRPGAIVTLRLPAHGGLGRSLLTLAIIAAAVYAPYAAPASWGLVAPGGGLTLLGSAVSAGVMVVGSLIANALVPPRLPTAPGDAPAAERIYSLAGGANAARPHQPLLLVLGTHRVWPDLAAAPYTEHRGGEQYLSQIVDLGLGRLAATPLQLGGTPLTSYDDVAVEEAMGGAAITTVHEDVDAVAGGTLEWDADASPPAGTWITRRSSTTTRVGIDLVARLFQITDKGDLAERVTQVRIEHRPAAGGSWTGQTVTLRSSSQTPLRETYHITVPAGAHDVRLRRLEAPPDSPREQADVDWAGLRSYRAADLSAAARSGRNRVGLTIRASGQLSGRLDRLSTVVTQIVRRWDAGTRAWVDATGPSASNPAWIFRWFALGIRDSAGNLLAGVGLDAGMIDDDALMAWGAWCDAERLRCDWVLDRGGMTQMQVLTAVAQCGRATVSWATGRLGVVWDAPGRVPSALVTPSSIVAASYRAIWSGEQVADEIVATYTDRDADWTRQEVRRRAPGAVHASLTVTLDLPGVTTRAQAQAEVALQAARQVYHRRRHVWRMAAGALAAVRGDVVHLTHSLVDGGVAGRCRAVSADRASLRLNRSITLDHRDDRLLCTLPDGRLHLSALTSDPPGGDETDRVTLTTPLPAPPEGDEWDPADILWRFYGGAGPPRQVRIVALTPGEDGEVEVAAIDEEPLYYTAPALDPDAPLPLSARRIPRVLSGVVTERLIRVGTGLAVELELTLTVAGDWRTATVSVAEDGRSLRTVTHLIDGDTVARWISPPTGTMVVHVTPGSSAAPAGPTWTLSYTVRGALVPPAPPTNFLVDVLPDGTRRFRWIPPADADLAGVQIRFAADAAAAIEWGRMRPMHRGLLTASPWETFEPPAGQWVFAARSRDTGGRWSETDARIVAQLGDQSLAQALVWECPAAEGWPGTVTNALTSATGTAAAIRSDDGRDALEAVGRYRWSDLTTWAAWSSWGAGTGTGGSLGITYAPPPYDVAVATEQLGWQWEGDAVGTVAMHVRSAATAAAIRSAIWHPAATRPALHRWVQPRWSLSGTGAEVLSLDHLCWSLTGPVITYRYIDRRIDSFVNHANSGFHVVTVPVPASITTVTDVDVTIQGATPGATWVLSRKAAPVLLTLSGVTLATLLDITLRGF